MNNIRFDSKICICSFLNTENFLCILSISVFISVFVFVETEPSHGGIGGTFTM